MTNGMMHDEFSDALAAEAVDALDGEERERLLAHLAGCPACGAELESLRASAAVLAFAAPHAPMDPARSAAVRGRLLARAAADRESVTAIAPAPSPAAARGDGADVTLVAPPPASSVPPSAPVPGERDVIPIAAARRRPPVLPWLAAAASLALLLSVGSYAASLRGRLSAMAGEVEAAERQRDQATRALEEREATLAAISAPSSRVIEMAAARPQAPGGRMFWNVSTSRWTFFAHHLPPVRAGREYQLWLVTTDERKISAGTFRPDAAGHAVVEATYALPADALAAVAVTEEPAGGVPQPTGEIVIAGAAAAGE